MTTRVLVFESDSEFSQTLISGLSAYGCELKVVADGEEGIALAASDAPDLILLTIELPRMNGFSVCNKLKRNKDLKSVPLVLLSSEATEETFEQHKRLRTRADAYIHKPVTVDELVNRLDGVISLQKAEGTPGDVEEFEEIPMDDEMEMEEVSESDDVSDVDAETDEAFGNLMAPPADESDVRASVSPNSDEALTAAVDLSKLNLSDPNDGLEMLSAASVSSRPAPAGVDPALLQEEKALNAALSAEASELRKRVNELDEELRGARAATAAEEDAKAQALAKKEAELSLLEREIEGLKGQMASSETAGTAREFLDLREQLNKKDKEILDIRDGLTSREKELIRSKDENIALGREKADLQDKVINFETQVAQIQKERDSLEQDKEQVSKKADDFKAKSERLAQDLATRNSELKEAREQYENAMATRDAQEASLREDHKKALEDAAQEASAAQQKAVDAAILVTQEEGAEAQEAALVLAAEEAQQSQQAAIAAREVELKSEQDSKMAALHRANGESLRKLRAEHEQAAEEAAEAFAEQLSAREGELAGQQQLALDELRSEMESQYAEVDARRAALEEELKTRTHERDILLAKVAEGESAVVTLEASVASGRAEVVELSDKLLAESNLLAQARAKWSQDLAALNSAKEALTSALVQVEESLGREMP